MFQDKLKPEATPERVFELCRIVASYDKADSDSDVPTDKIREIIEPSSASASTAYFPSIKKAALELGLLKEADNTLGFVGDRNSIKDFDHFRKHCNSVLFNDKSWEFYKLCNAFLLLNDKWLSIGSITSDESVILLVEYSSYPANDLRKTLVPASRFWLSFLGFGYIQESSKLIFLPNAYVALKDFMSMVELEKGREYSIAEFFELMPCGFSVLYDCDSRTTEINLALSNALRQLHDSKEIELKRNPDSETVWSLFMNEGHEFKSQITHLVYKGVR